MMDGSQCGRVDLPTLLGEFFGDVTADGEANEATNKSPTDVLSAVKNARGEAERYRCELGSFESITDPPPPYDDLLRHEHHMTVTVEAFHQTPVDVRVHRFHRTGDWYVREITLTKTGTDTVVQYGIVRFDVTSVQPQVWREIESQTVPLGRVLIQHDVLRQVHLCRLWKITAAKPLADHLGVSVGTTVYGRTALIDCNGQPAIELLEVVP